MTNLPTNLIGTGNRLFADPTLSPDESSFLVENTSSQYYNSPYYTAHKSDIKPVPAPRSSPPRMELADVLPADLLDQIQGTKRISFHAVGDTGAAKVNPQQTAAQAIAQEAEVADAMSADLAQGDGAAPAFFFHLGDVVYNFGESQYYYDQFYEPFRQYDRPIFAIPGNHDGAAYGHDPNVPDNVSLAGFLRNFCAPTPQTAPDAGGLVRSAMNQPGVYFTLDAPFVSLVGLYSNALEELGGISSQDGPYPIRDEQLAPPLLDFGYLTGTVDMATTASTLTVRFRSCGKKPLTDEVTLTLADGQIVGAPQPVKPRG